jgi:caffeoyl-CoA O-methyltransferase
MSTSFALAPALVGYLENANPPLHPVLARCRAETAALGGVARMQVSAEQGALMQLFARLMNARRVVEVGVFTGYSALAVGLVLHEMHGDQTHMLACDVSEEWTAKARGFWREAGIDGVIDLQIAPAVETLAVRTAAGEAGTYDLAFIDADKTSYDAYYEACLTLLRPGGLMLFDNVLWGGSVADPANTSPDTVALRAIGQKAKADPRVHAAMASVGDGLLLCIKK